MEYFLYTFVFENGYDENDIGCLREQYENLPKIYNKLLQ